MKYRAITQGFRLFPNVFEAIDSLPDDSRLRLYDAISRYGFLLQEPDLDDDPQLRAIFLLYLPMLEKSIRSFEQNTENGSCGGRPKKTGEKTEAEKSVITKKEIRKEKKEKGKEKIETGKEKEENTKGGLKPEPFDVFAEGQEDLREALREFEKMREKIKRPLTDGAKERLVLKLRKEFPPEQWIPILNQSTDNCWRGIFPLRDEKQEGAEPYADENRNRDYCDDFARA